MIYLASLQESSKSEILWKKQAAEVLETRMRRSQFSALSTVWRYPFPSSMGNLVSLKKWIQRATALGTAHMEKSMGEALGEQIRFHIARVGPPAFPRLAPGFHKAASATSPAYAHKASRQLFSDSSLDIKEQPRNTRSMKENSSCRSTKPSIFFK